MDLKVATVLGLFLFLLFSTMLFGLYVWWKKSVYTREKFAFVGLAAGATLTLYVVTSTYAKEPPWLAAIGLIKQVLGFPLQQIQPPTWEQHFVAISMVALLWALIFRIHRNWDGARSVNQYEQQQKAQAPNLFNDAKLALYRDKNKALLALHDSANQRRPSALRGADDRLAWNEQARELIELSNPHIEISDDGWHRDAQCWIGTHTGTGEVVVLACYDDKPRQTELNLLTEYAEKVRLHNKASEIGIYFIVALRDGDTDEYTQAKGYNLRIVSESRLLDALVNFESYFRILRDRVEKEPLLGSELTLKDVYTPPRFRLNMEDEARPGLEDFLNAWLNEPGFRQIALLGEYGQGKSTASLMLSYHLMERIRQDQRTTRVPLLLELRGKSPRTLTENQMLAIWAEPYGIDPRALRKLLVAGRLLLILEGFDEVDLVGNSDVRIDHFTHMWGLCYPKAKILVTGRRNYFLNDGELKAALGIQELSLERPYCEPIYLVPFEYDEISLTLRNLDRETRDGILELARKNDRFMDIVSRPSMLHVVSTLWHRENLAKYGQRINSAVVMDLFVRHSYERQGGKSQKFAFSPSTGMTRPAFMALNIRERGYFMEGIATYMLVNNLPNQITNTQLEDVVRMLVGAIPEAVSLVDAQGGETRNPLHKRFELDSRPEELQTILTDVRACGLLVPDLSRNGSFKFGHKSFMEFLAGKVFAQWNLRKEVEPTEERIASSLVNTLGLKMRHVLKHSEVIAFAVEWIAEKAKDRSHSARLLFMLIFRQHNYFMKLISTVLRANLSFLYYLKDIKILQLLARISSNIDLTPGHSKLTLKLLYAALFTGKLLKASLYFLPIIFLSIKDDLIFLFDVDINNFGHALFALSIAYAILFIASENWDFLSQLMLGYLGIDEHPNWVRFRAWYSICIAANIERTAIVSVIGERSLSLLEDGLRDSRTWSVAESLERMRGARIAPISEL